MSLDSDANLVAFYRFNNPANVGLDSSPGGTNSMTAVTFGPVASTVTAVSDTVRGSVLRTTATGSDSVSWLELASRFGSATNNITLAAWILVTGGSNDNNTFHALSIGGLTSILKLPNNQLAAGWYQTSIANFATLQTASAVSTGWHHMALTISATAQILYVDGTNVASATYTNANNISYPVGNANNFTRIGIRDFPGANVTNTPTLVDDVRYYNRALSPSEVTLLATFGASNMNAAQTFTEDTTLSLSDANAIVISNTISAIATLTLSNLSAGSIVPQTDSTDGASSEFDESNGVWSASGTTGGVNTLLGRISFEPSANFASNFTMSTSVAGDATTIFGSKAMTAVAVNDAPSTSGLSAAETYTQDTPKNLTPIIVSDVDNSTLTVTLTLSTPLAGLLSTPTVAGIMPTFNTETGVWTAIGSPTNLNLLLANPIIFQPTAGYNSDFNIATSVSDGTASQTGSKAMRGIAVISNPNTIICFAAGTELTTANGKTVRIEQVPPGAILSASLCGKKKITVKSVVSCWSWKVVEFMPFSLHPNQTRKLITSPNHLLYNFFTGHWTEACFMTGGIQLILTQPICLYNIQAHEGWKTMIANNVLCETCALTDFEKQRRANTLERYKIRHAI